MKFWIPDSSKHQEAPHYVHNTSPWSELALLVSQNWVSRNRVITGCPRAQVTSPVWWRCCEPERKTESQSHHPINSCLSCSNFILPKGFVKISAQLECVSTLTICREPFLMWSSKWWFFKDILVLCLKLVSVVAITMPAVSSSNT